MCPRGDDRSSTAVPAPLGEGGFIQLRRESARSSLFAAQTEPFDPDLRVQYMTSEKRIHYTASIAGRIRSKLRLQEARQLMLNENLDARVPAGVSGTKARRNSVASPVDCSARRLSAMSRACGWLRLLAPTGVERSQGPRLVEPHS